MTQRREPEAGRRGLLDAVGGSTIVLAAILALVIVGARALFDLGLWPTLLLVVVGGVAIRLVTSRRDATRDGRDGAAG